MENIEKEKSCESVFNSGSSEQKAINTKRNQLSSHANIWQHPQRRQQQQQQQQAGNNNYNNNNKSSNNHKMLEAYSSKLKLKLKLKRISRHLTSLQVAQTETQMEA